MMREGKASGWEEGHSSCTGRTVGWEGRDFAMQKCRRFCRIPAEDAGASQLQDRRGQRSVSALEEGLHLPEVHGVAMAVQDNLFRVLLPDVAANYFLPPSTSLSSIPKAK